MNEDKIREKYRAYYFSLIPTGNPYIDEILKCVAQAGKSSHSTDGWNNPRTRVDKNDTRTYIEAIQEAAYQAALATRPDINQELVEALEEIKQEASINFVSEIASLWQCIQSIKTMAIQALAKHKAGDDEPVSGGGDDKAIKMAEDIMADLIKHRQYFHVENYFAPENQLKLALWKTYNEAITIVMSHSSGLTPSVNFTAKYADEQAQPIKAEGVNQELVEALEATLKALEWAEVTIDNEYGCRDIAGIEADGDLSPDIIHAREVLAKHKAGDAGFTEEEL